MALLFLLVYAGASKRILHLTIAYCTLTLIVVMQGHQQKGRQTNTSSNGGCSEGLDAFRFFLNKDKSNTIIIETSTAEDHDDENLHNPSTRPRYSPGSRRRAVGDLLL